MSSRKKASWTFLSNHGHILVFINKNPDAKIKEIADEVGVTERRALGILAELEEAGYISVKKVGRRNTYKVNSRLRFRHPIESDKPISALLRIFS
jgi:DNA-binding MarR family transcriptional regulator